MVPKKLLSISDSAFATSQDSCLQRLQQAGHAGEVLEAVQGSGVYYRGL